MLFEVLLWLSGQEYSARSFSYVLVHDSTIARPDLLCIPPPLTWQVHVEAHMFLGILLAPRICMQTSIRSLKVMNQLLSEWGDAYL